MYISCTDDLWSEVDEVDLVTGCIYDLGYKKANRAYRKKFKIIKNGMKYFMQ